MMPCQVMGVADQEKVGLGLKVGSEGLNRAKQEEFQDAAAILGK